jgi:predicted cupin superfamily sugar epimerase
MQQVFPVPARVGTRYDFCMQTRISAEEVKALLHLEPHPREGGWFRETWKANEVLPAPAARYAGPRAAGTAIYYLLEPNNFSEMHRLQSDEVFHFYLGDPVEMLQLHPNGEGRRIVLGRDLAGGEWPQVVVPKGVWQGSRLISGGKFALLGCTVSPGFEYEDYESGSRDALAREWQDWRDLIIALTHG